MDKTYAFYIGGIQLANIDDASGTIKDVRIITEGAALGHDIDVDSKTIDQILAACQAYKNGVKVKMDHDGGAGDIPGYVNNFRKVSDGSGEYLLGDLHLFSNHPQRDYILELAKTIPDTFGLSCFFIGIPETVDGRDKVRCTRVFSCDIVTEPAANPSLFNIGPVLKSTTETSQVDKKKTNMTPEEFAQKFKECMAAYENEKTGTSENKTVVPTKETHEIKEDGSEKHVITKGPAKPTNESEPDEEESEMAARISGMVMSNLAKSGIRIAPSSTSSDIKLSETKKEETKLNTFEDICFSLRTKGDESGKKYGIEEAVHFAIRNYPSEHFDYIKRCQAEGPQHYEYIQLSRDPKNYLPPFTSKVEHWKVQGTQKPGSLK